MQSRFPATVLARYADTLEKQNLGRQQHFANLDRCVFEGQFY